MDGHLVPKRFFVTSGVVIGATSELSAFDRALKEAGIMDCNLVGVSSIIPSGAVETDPVEIPRGAITFCVLAKMTGRDGDRVGAGLAWAWGTAEDGVRYGIVAEHHGAKRSSVIEATVREELLVMAQTRGLELEEIRTRIVSTICRDGHGCAVAALVYAP